ncbi:MAG: lysoplasmalogenase [Balneolaceae bacterium]
MITALSILFFTLVILSIYVKETGQLNYYFYLKPSTTSLLILISTLIYLETESDYSLIILVSLFFSLLGDIFLLKDDNFVKGISSFLVAHIGFTTAFTSFFGIDIYLPPLLILLTTGLIYFLYLKKDLKKLTIPVFLYLLVIIVMNWQAINPYLINQSPTFLGIALGSILFTFSDAIIAFQKFKRSFKGAEFLILSTYWMAIYLFTIAGLNSSF